MKKLLFVMTHLGSGSDQLCKWLRTSDRIDGQTSSRIYDGPQAFYEMGSIPHKLGNSSSVYLEEIFHNYQFTCRAYIPHCQFLHLMRHPRPTLSEIIYRYPEYSAYEAANYYHFRIRGIAEYALRCGGLFLTWDRIEGVENYLRTKFGPLPSLTEYPARIPEELVQECEVVYNRYSNYLRGIFDLPADREEKINSLAMKDLPSN